VRGKFNKAGSMGAAANWTWKSETIKGSFLALQTDSYGKRKIWRALSVASTISEGDPPAWADALALNATEIVCDNPRSRITNIVPYDKGIQVFKEDQIGSVVSRVYSRIPLDEMKTVAGPTNGRAAIQHDVYLYFSLGNGLQKFYQGRLDNMGPDLGEGLPSATSEFANRQGPISSMAGAPGRIYASINAGEYGSSSVLCYNGTGWHEIFRDRGYRRAKRIHVQPIPGHAAQLWISLEEDTLSIPVSMSAPEKMAEFEYLFTGRGSIESSWIYGSLKDVNKFWNSIKIFSDGLADNIAWIELEYKTDAQTAWTRSESVFETSPSQEIDLGLHDVVGRRFRFRLTLRTVSHSITPKIKQIIIETVTRVPPKWSYPITFYLADVSANLSHDVLRATAAAMTAKLKLLADSRSFAAPVRMRSLHNAFDDRWVFVEPASISPITLTEGASREIRLIGSLTLQEA
jgi:hypothetical protein